MAVYFSKNRGSWYIRLSWKGRQHYCYGSPSGAFVSKRAASDFEPVFSASLMGATEKPVFCETLVISFYSFLQSSVKDSSLKGYELCFSKRWLPSFVGVPASEVSDVLVESALKRALSGLSSFSKVVSVGKHWVRFLKRFSPSLDPGLVFSKRVYKKDPLSYDFYTKEEFDRFLSAVSSPRDRLLFSCLYYFALRETEALALMYSDFRGRYLYIRRILSAKGTKNGQEFTFPKTASSADRLARVPQVDDLLGKWVSRSDYLFPSKVKGKVMGASTLDRLNRAYASKAGLRHIKLHEFRHSCACYLFQQGLPIRFVSRWLRHSSEEVTLRFYSHLFPGEDKAVSDFWASQYGQNRGKSVVRKNEKT